MTTIKDFELIAAAVRESRKMYTSPDHVAALNDVTLTLSDALARSNPRFDRERFKAACGMVSP